MSGIRAASLALLLVAARQEDPANLEKLLEQLGDDRVETRDAAVDVLSRFDPQALPRLRQRLKDLAPEPRLRLAEALRRIEETTRILDFLPPYRPVTLHFDHQASTLALQELAEQTGLPIDLGECPKGRDVTAEIVGRTPLEALQTICREADLGWRLEGMPDWRGRTRGTRPTRVRIHEVSDAYWRPQSTAYIRHYQLIAGLGGATPVNGAPKQTIQVSILPAPGVRPHSVSGIEVTALVDKNGRSLLDQVLPQPLAIAPIGIGQTAIHRPVTFATPDGFPVAIDRLAGRVTIRYPKRIEGIRFRKLTPPYGEGGEVYGLRFTLVNYERQGSRHSLELGIRGPEGTRLSLLDLDAGKVFNSDEIELVVPSGERLRAAGGSGWGNGVWARMIYDYVGTKEEDAVEVRIPWVDRFVEDVVEFELRDIR